MKIIFANSIKRLRREGLKSFAVPLIAFTLVVLINSLGGIREMLNEQYEYTMDNFVIVAQLSDLSGTIVDDLRIEERHIELFTDPNAPLSLYDFTSNLIIRRTLDAEILSSGESFTLMGVIDKVAIEPEYGEAAATVTFFEGYDESVFKSEERAVIISDDLMVYTVDGMLSMNILNQLPGEWVFDYSELSERFGMRIEFWEGTFYLVSEFPDGSESWTNIELDVLADEFDFEYTYVEGEVIALETKLVVVGTVSGTADGMVYAPFWAVGEIVEELLGEPKFSEHLSMTLANNRDLLRLKGIASLSFSRVRPVGAVRPLAMTIYDSEFFETLEPLRQNIILVDVTIPIIYFISVIVGFLTSMVLTRQRKAEFAILRSVGVRSRDIFVGALSEQFMLSFIGALAGLGVIAVALRYMSLESPMIFLACYMLGAIFSASRAARTNVLLLLRDRE